MNAEQALPLDDAPWTARAFFRLLSRLQAGSLDLVTPDGMHVCYAGALPGPHARLEIRDWRALGRIARSAEIGLFEAWRDGQVATPDMVAVLRLGSRNAPVLGAAYRGHWLTRVALRFAHALRANTRAGSRRNIEAHYDLGNAFYALWLDPSMTYSSALFAERGQDLAAAQHAKYDRAIEVLGLAPSHSVLEIGCGWGGFAERAAARSGCRVTGLTLSHEQLAYARERMGRAGLEGRVALHLRDYRDERGTYDRIVSLEMLEAVGERYWPAYFRTLHDRLAPGGRALVQSITIAEDAFEDYRRTSDFIREYVFPGGMLPTLTRMEVEGRRAGLVPRTPFRFGPHYAETLRRWRRAFDAAEAQVRALGFDDAFLATWRFYLDYCEAGFEEGRIDVVQMELARP